MKEFGENCTSSESLQRQLADSADKLHRTEQLLKDAQKVALSAC